MKAVVPGLKKCAMLRDRMPGVSEKSQICGTGMELLLLSRLEASEELIQLCSVL